jgi:anthranilate synthase component I
MTELEFEKLAEQGYKRIPVVAQVRSDLYTPLAVYMKLAGGPFTYLLESVVGGERFGRYSYVGLSCTERLEVRGRRVRRLLRDARGSDVCVEATDADPFEYVGRWLEHNRSPNPPSTLRFAGGLAGYFGYETVRHVESRALGSPKPDPIGTPDALLLLSDELAVLDNVLGYMTLVVHADPMQPGALKRARSRLADLQTRLLQPLPTAAMPVPPSGGAGAATRIEHSISQAQFMAAVARCKEYILSGDVMQVQISQRATRPFNAAPLALYRALRSVNPSPYMFYFDFDDHHVVGASPEILVRLAGSTVTLRPIAGTRPRGGSPSADAALAAELLADAKERAEHVMLIDLGRNDVGRVAKAGSVRVTERMVVERYSHVMHLVSNVEGDLAAGLSIPDVLRATFPAGTVTGAPKVRAMQIIDELEPVKRGIYSGAVGHIGFDGNMDLAIGIRTAVLKDGKLHIQAAAGIVADSDPLAEWQETQHKARALLSAAAVCDALEPAGQS